MTGQNAQERIEARPLDPTRPRGGYGLWEATLTTRDGRTFTGGGSNQNQAEYRARLRAQEARAL